jgi:conjugal transfer pilus assembly protein TraF
VKTLVLIVAFMLAGAAQAQRNALDYDSIWQCDEARFNWYCDEDAQPTPQRQVEPPKPVPSNPQTQPKRLELRDIKTAEQMRVELKRREDVAVMQPTDANLKDYLQLWQIAQDKGSAFADNWRRVVWQTPELDYSLKRPTNNVAIKTYDAARESNEEQQLRDLAKDHGLIFFFRSDCPYCHAMAPILKGLSSKYGIEVLGVSLDGRGLTEFPNPRDGRNRSESWGVERVPALFIGSKRTGDKAAIGFGTMAQSDIVNRIFVLTGTKPGEKF